MPTVLRGGPYRFYWYSHEPGEPPHVHVDRDSRTAKIWLEPIVLARNIGFSAHEIRVISGIVEAHQAEFLEAWYGYFGSKR